MIRRMPSKPADNASSSAMTAEHELPGVPLPVDAALPQLLAVLAKGSTAVLSAAPGAGKTTRVPFALAAAPWCGGMVVVLEPRRIAARAAAGFMAAQLKERPGETVGYRVRLESRASARTRILFVTEGVFARMIMDDPELPGVSAIVFDEFHERSLDADLGLALALDVQSALRPELRILVMSATLETQAIAKMLGDAPVIESPGRSFEVELRYEERGPNEAVEDAVARTVRRALAQEEGSVLAFLPGQKEIRRTAERLGALPADVRLFQLYGAIDPREQDAAIRPPARGERKVVLATSIAETSLTIDGVRVVVDSGLKRVPRYEPRTGLTRLETVRASRSAIAQRAGRAGRTAPGIAIRLWREQQDSALPQSDTPEILEADLAGLALDLAAWGVGNPAQLAFLDLPPAPAWGEAVELLKRLGALDGEARITPTGKAMRNLPLPPRFAHMVVEAGQHGQALDAAMLAVLASERGLGGVSTDLAQRLDRLRSEKGERANAARGLARSIAHGLDHAPHAGLSAGALLSLAWPDRIARSRGKGGSANSAGTAYRLANGRGAVIDEAEALARSPWLVIADMQGTAAAPRILAAAAIEPAEIEMLHGGAFVTTREVTLDPASGRIRVRQMRRLGALTLGDVAGELTAADAPHAILFAHLREHGLDVLDWGKAASRLRDRLMFLHAQDFAWPDVSDAALLASLEEWLLPFLGLPKGLPDITPQRLHEGLAFLLASSGKSLAEAERKAPEHFTTPAGSNVPIRYEENAAYLAVRVQELFGLARHPAIMDGDYPLTLELLSPAHRPMQVTRDLPGFWKGSWSAVRSEMRGRYPRHPWPEDPASAAPTTRAKPRGT
jgi:ATP-dependent helicase HrpB